LIKIVIEQQLKCGSTMKLIGRVLRFFKKIRPRYFLSLDSHFYSLSKKDIVYRFKVFGEHTFPKFTFDDIKNDKNLLYDIHPTDLMKITIDDYVTLQKKSMLSISEILRDNRYRLSDSNTDEILSGDEICDNILLIEKIKNIDLYKIAYNTGFNHGRQLAREISKKVGDAEKILSENVITLQLAEGSKE
jgi:hypothetical protein